VCAELPIRVRCSAPSTALALTLRTGQSARMRWGRSFVFVGAIGLLAGCSHECKKMGCIAGVNVWVPNAFPVAQLPVDVTTCADAVCNTATFPAGSAQGQTTFIVSGMVTLNETRERDVVVTIEVKSITDGVILIQASGSARLRRSQPNGKGCEPVCYGASLTYPATGPVLQQS
jgi:hypothetical protein